MKDPKPWLYEGRRYSADEVKAHQQAGDYGGGVANAVFAPRDDWAEESA